MTNETDDFTTWMEAVNEYLASLCSGMDSEVMTDWNWFDAYCDGMSETEAVEAYLEEEGLEDLLHG